MPESAAKRLGRLRKGWVHQLHRWSFLQNYLPARTFGPGHNVRKLFGKLRPPFSCSIVAADHCNLSCLDCNHASPILPPAFADPEEVLASCTVLAKVYRPRTVNLIGGEPLLHPRLADLIRTVRSSGLGRHVCLVTNGTLLSRQPVALWENLNALELSLYPGVEPDREGLAAIREQARRHQVNLRAFRFDAFRISFSARGTSDPELARRIFRSCELVHLWGCHTVAEGFFFKCPQAIYAPRIPGSRAGHDFREDGVPLLGSKDLQRRLRDYLDDDRPLRACGFCLGTVGRDRPHRLVPPREWAEHHDRPAEELVDFEKLEKIERGMGRFVEHRDLVL